MDTISEFENKYLKYDFDKILNDKNNVLVNSDIYLDVKQKYLQETTNNIEKYTQMFNEKSSLVDNHSIKNDGNVFYHVYNYTNCSKCVNSDLKKVLLNQRHLFKNIIQFINTINK